MLQFMQDLASKRTEEPGSVRAAGGTSAGGVQTHRDWRSKLYELIRAGEIGIFKIGTMTLISTAELERFLATQKEACPSGQA